MAETSTWVQIAMLGRTAGKAKIKTPMVSPMVLRIIWSCCQSERTLPYPKQAHPYLCMCLWISLGGNLPRGWPCWDVTRIHRSTAEGIREGSQTCINVINIWQLIQANFKLDRCTKAIPCLFCSQLPVCHKPGNQTHTVTCHFWKWAIDLSQPCGMSGFPG